MKSRLVIGVPSDHFHGFSTIVMTLSPSDHFSELYRLSCGFGTELAPSPA